MGTATTPTPRTRHSELDERVAAVEASAVGLRRQLHSCPELGFETHATAKLIATALTKLGLEVRTGVGRTGVVADIPGNSPGPRLLLRADMDALPISEMTALPYASVHPGRMHACGHDMHSAALVGVARILLELSHRFAGSVRLVFQPAEETVESGAAAMIADGVAIGADYALGFHNRPDIAVGRIEYVRGAATASSDEFDVEIIGRSAHASRPHESIDPILTAVAAISQLQLAAVRLTDPGTPAVLAIGAIQAGSTHNIIPDRCTFRGTIRCRSEETRKRMELMLRRVCESVCNGVGAKYDISFVRGVPSIINDEHLLETVVDALKQELGPEIIGSRIGQFESEDFSYFSQIVPACQILIGSGRAGHEDILHNGHYNPDERFIASAMRAIVVAVMAILPAS